MKPQRGISPVKRSSRDNGQLLILGGVFLVFFATMSILSPGTFLSLGTMKSMFVQLPEFGIYSIAMMFAMLLGGIDLSIVSVGNLSSILAGQVMIRWMAASPNAGQVEIVLAGIGTALFVGALCGAFNGFSIAVIGIPPILATLSSMAIFNGVSTLITKGSSLQGFPEGFAQIGMASAGGLFPVIMIVFLLIALAVFVIQRYTALGMHMELIGSNAVAAEFSGIPTHRVIILSYAISGLLSSVAGLILSSRSMSARLDYGSIYQLQSILAVVLGGISPKGGKGKVLGVVLAVLSLQVLSTGLNILNLVSTSYLKNLVWGILLLAVLLLNYFMDRKKT